MKVRAINNFIAVDSRDLFNTSKWVKIYFFYFHYFLAVHFCDRLRYVSGPDEQLKFASKRCNEAVHFY